MVKNDDGEFTDVTVALDVCVFFLGVDIFWSCLEKKQRSYCTVPFGEGPRESRHLLTEGLSKRLSSENLMAIARLAHARDAWLIEVYEFLFKFGWCTPPKFNIAPETSWLEDYCPFGMAYFQGRTVKLPGCTSVPSQSLTCFTWKWNPWNTRFLLGNHHF